MVLRLLRLVRVVSLGLGLGLARLAEVVMEVTLDLEVEVTTAVALATLALTLALGMLAIMAMDQVDLARDLAQELAATMAADLAALGPALAQALVGVGARSKQLLKRLRGLAKVVLQPLGSPRLEVLSKAALLALLLASRRASTQEAVLRLSLAAGCFRLSSLLSQFLQAKDKHRLLPQSQAHQPLPVRLLC